MTASAPRFETIDPRLVGPRAVLVVSLDDVGAYMRRLVKAR